MNIIISEWISVERDECVESKEQLEIVNMIYSNFPFVYLLSRNYYDKDWAFGVIKTKVLLTFRCKYFSAHGQRTKLVIRCNNKSNFCINVL